MRKIFLIITIMLVSSCLKISAAKLDLPAPAYLSSPYFERCKAACPVVKNGKSEQLNMDCINGCIWFYESKQSTYDAFSRSWSWLKSHI